jgi:chitinase
MKTQFRLIKILLFTFFILFISGNKLLAGNRIIGYYPYWIKSTLPADNILFKDLTHINHAFAWPDAQGNIKFNAELIYPQLNQLAHGNDIKVLISLGGWGHADGFAPMAADSTSRAAFITNLINFLKDNAYDGVDFDWEFPQNTTEKNNFTILIRELRQQFDQDNPDFLITMAVPISNWSGQWLDFAKLKNNVDWFNAMCYDVHGSWTNHAGHNAPLFSGDSDGGVDIGMNYLHKTRGIPKNQLTVGMPFNGKQFNASALYASKTGDVTDLLFSEIAPMLNGSWTYNWDEKSQAPYLTNSANTKLITFDDTVSIRLKCEWIIEQGYSGGMIWALGQDLTNSSQPLLTTIGKHLSDKISSLADEPDNTLKTFLLAGNYPNPFNPETKIVFNLPQKSKTEIRIFNARGQIIETLFKGLLTSGTHKITFNGAQYASGLYVYQIIYNDQRGNQNKKTGKMILLK